MKPNSRPSSSSTAKRLVLRSTSAMAAASFALLGWPCAGLSSPAVATALNAPNVIVSVDAGTLAPVLGAQDVFKPEWIFFKGQTSLVTPGPKTGFALVPCADCLAFSLGQWGTSTTNIQGFNEQIRAQGGLGGRLITRMYQVGAQTIVQTHMNVTTAFRPTGVSIHPQATQSVVTTITTEPAPGGGLARAATTLVGLGQRKITQKIYDQSVGQIVEGVEAGAQELTALRLGQEQAKLNASLAPYLLGGTGLGVGTKDLGSYGLTGLRLSTTPARLSLAAVFKSLGLSAQASVAQTGAPTPRPASMSNMPAGIVADIHLPSVLTNVAMGLFESPQGRAFKNALIESRPTPPGRPPLDGFALSWNQDLPRFLQAVDVARARRDGSQVTRVGRPSEPPVFAMDTSGNLGVTIKNLVVEQSTEPEDPNDGLPPLPGPVAVAQRLYISRLDVGLSVSLASSKGQGQKPDQVVFEIGRLDFGDDVKLQSLDARGQVIARPGQNSSAATTSAFERRMARAAARASLASSLGLPRETCGTVTATALQSYDQPIVVPYSVLQDALGQVGLSLSELSALDPSGWTRIVLSLKDTSSGILGRLSSR